MKQREKKKYNLADTSARVDRVVVSGLRRTHDDYVQRVPDSLFEATNLQEVILESMKARSYLIELGIFKDVDVHIDVSRGDNATPEGYQITFKGLELSHIVGSVGTEVGQSEGSLRTELTIPNILGRGESISLVGSYSSTRANDVSFKIWKPYFHTRFVRNRPELSLSLFRRIDRMDISSYQTSNLGANIDVSFNSFFPVGLTHSFQYEAAVREIALLNKSVPFAIREHCGPKLASLLRYSVAYDERDNSIFPTKGLLAKAVNEYCGGGLGGNISYVSSTAHVEANVPLFGGISAQLSGRVGVVKATKYTITLPLNNLLYCGGPLTLRGFKFGGAGPSVEGTPIGAQTYWSSAFHLWAPLPFQSIFKGLAPHIRTHLFYNVGNYNTFSLESMRSAVGFGIALKLAERARIELNYCIPLNKMRNDKPVKGFQFGIGYEFV